MSVTSTRVLEEYEEYSSTEQPLVPSFVVISLGVWTKVCVCGALHLEHDILWPGARKICVL